MHVCGRVYVCEAFDPEDFDPELEQDTFNECIAFTVRTLLQCGRFCGADAFAVRTLLRCGRFYSADAFTVRTLLQCGFTVWTLLVIGC